MAAEKLTPLPGEELSPEWGWHECGDEADVEGVDNELTIRAKVNGVYAGYVSFVVRNKRLEACNLEVNPEFRRKGLATRMYVEAEEIAGLKCVPHSSQSPEGRAFWNQKDRPFGC